MLTKFEWMMMFPWEMRRKNVFVLSNAIDMNRNEAMFDMLTKNSILFLFLFIGFLHHFLCRISTENS